MVVDQEQIHEEPEQYKFDAELKEHHIELLERIRNDNNRETTTKYQR